jgi:CubicO group peptidase (beta-lactamase class C family)
MEALSGFERFVRTRMREWHVCGLAVGIVRGTEPVYVGGFGLRNARSGLPVTTDTLFAIASATKAFTATAAGILVDEKRLDLDKPVREYLPRFRLMDAVATEHMTMRDLLCHRSGLPRHDMVWYKTPLSRRELLDRLRYLEPTRDFRQAYQYQNLMFMAAGVVIEEISGLTWEDFVRARILDPLDMADANLSIEDSKHSPDFAVGCRWAGDRYVRIPLYNLPAIAPAGSINASIADMCKWVLLNLNKGRYNGRQIISERVLADIHSPQMVIPGVPSEHELLPAAYGLGWTITAYRGHLLVRHDGAIDGFRSRVALLPRDQVGVVLLSNFEASNVPGGEHLQDVVSFNLFDRLLGLRPVPWIRRFRRAVSKQQAEQKAKKRKAAPRHSPVPPSRALSAYAGEFRHPAYGCMTVVCTKDRLRADLHGIRFRLRHDQGDAFRAAVLHYPTETTFEFRVSEKQGVHAVAAVLDSENQDLKTVFRRVKGRRPGSSG